MRVVVGLVFLLGLHTPSLAAPSGWSIAWPTGWTDQTVAYAARPELQDQIRKVKGMGGSLEVTAYGDDNGTILVFYIRLEKEAGTRGDLVNFEAGARDSLRQSTADVKYETVEDATAIVTDQVVEIAGQRRFVRRVTGYHRGVVSVAVTCVATAEICEPALRSLVVDRAGFVPLADLKSGGLVDESSDAYLAGRIVGLVVLAGLFGWFAWSQVKRRKRG